MKGALVVSRLVVAPTILFATHVPGVGRSGETLTVVPFLSLARELAALLLPVRPRPQFRADLERSLVAAARQQNAHMALTGFTPRATNAIERRWVIGAAAAAVGSAVSIAGVVAYVLHRRSERAA